MMTIITQQHSQHRTFPAFINHLVLALLICITSGCTYYTTNSDIKFKTTQLYDQKPVIHVGEIKEKANDLILLGWVKATVTQPSYFSEDPTEEQANIVLAYKAKKLGADAVIFPEYKSIIAASTLRKIVAKGQAVKLRNNPKNPTPVNDDIPKEEMEVITNLPPTSAVKKVDPFSIAESMLKDPTLIEEQKPIITPMMLPVELTAIEKQQLKDQEHEETIVAYKLMLSNAQYLLTKSQDMHDKEMEKSASRIVQYLEQFLAKEEATLIKENESPK